VVSYGGESDRSDRYIQPTIVTDVKESDSLMSEEIFGPVVPIIKADYVSAINAVNTREHPLGLYIFSSDEREIKEIIDNTNSGGVTVNDIFLHAAVPNTPFGGVGESGHGSYHGKYGLLAFSHLRTIVALPAWLDFIMGFRYPPYKVENLSKSAVKNTLGFKKGETMEEQKISRPFLTSATKLRMAVGIMVVAVAIYRNSTIWATW